MGLTRNLEVVLVDSDSDAELGRISKRQKAEPQEGTIAPFTKAFMRDSDTDLVSSSDHQANQTGENATETASQDFDVPLTSSLSAPSVDSSDLDEIDEDDGKSDADAPPLSMKQTIYETRKFLKLRGVMEFLETFLPPTATSENIMDLIIKLGFVPRNIPPVTEGENLLQLIKLLHLAMKRVRQLRSRLENFYTVEHVLDKLRTAKKILVITGAGISTSLGIPDFRSSKGFYSRLSNLGLSDPQEVFDLDIFRTDPSIFYSIAYMILPPDNVYAPLHRFIKLLQDKNKLLRNYTQNIDNLEANAGILQDKMIQCHGSFAFSTCVTCGYQVPGETLYPLMRKKEIPYCPMCAKKRKKLMDNDDTYIEESYGVMKPNITFFGEALPRVFHDNINRDLADCDLVISIGTSLKVAPVADIVDKVRPEVPQILINKDPIQHCNFDVSLLGYCDDVVSYLCHRLGSEWAIDHADYPKLVGQDGQNLKLEQGDDKGVFHIHNLQREAELASMPPATIEEPDLVILEPTLN